MALLLRNGRAWCSTLASLVKTPSRNGVDIHMDTDSMVPSSSASQIPLADTLEACSTHTRCWPSTASLHIASDAGRCICVQM